MIMSAAIAIAMTASAILPAQVPQAPQPTKPRPTILLPAGSEITLALAYGVSARSARSGDPILLRTVSPISAKGKIIAVAGAEARGRVARAEATGGDAVLVIEAESIELGDRRIRLAGEISTRRPANRAIVSGGQVYVPLGGPKKAANLAAGESFLATTLQDY